MSRSGEKPKGTNRHGRSRDKMQRRLRQKRHLRNEEKQPTQTTHPFNKEKKMKRNITNIKVSAARWLALLPALAIFGTASAFANGVIDCNNLTGATFTTTSGGNVVNGNIY